MWTALGIAILSLFVVSWGHTLVTSLLTRARILRALREGE